MKAITRFLCFLATITVSAQTLRFEWGQNDDAAFVSTYRISQGQVSGSYTKSYDAGNTNSFILTNVLTGVTFFYAVQAVSDFGFESDYSNEIEVTLTLAPVIAPIIRLTPALGGVVWVHVSMPTVGASYRLDRSYDLKHWTMVLQQTSEGVGVSFPFSDSEPANFFRASGQFPPATTPPQ